MSEDEPRTHRLLDDELLESSSVVAHRFMNRERVLRGGNGYAREIGFDPLDFLVDRAATRARVSWLDLCCGSARALVEAGRRLEHQGLDDRVSIVGVDLVDAFTRERPRCVELVTASVHRLETSARHDLVTCVHGLHYIGDKLGLLTRACRWLSEDGVLVATFDVGTVQLRGRDARRQVPRMLRELGIEVDTRRHRVRARGGRQVEIPWRYLGADERGGPSFTGEAAVVSHYE